MSRYLRQLVRETHARLTPPSGLRLGPLAPALFQEVYEERSAPALPVTPPAIAPQQQFSRPAPPQQLRPAAPPHRTSQLANEIRGSAPPQARPPAPPQHLASPPPALTPPPTSSTTEAAVAWEFLQELSDTFVRPNAAPFEPAAKIARNIASEPTRPSRRPYPEPARETQAQLDVTIGRIDVTIEAEPQSRVRAQRREPRAISPSKPAPLSATGRLARQYLDR